VNIAGKQKPESTSIGRENPPRLVPRILPENPGRSYHAAGVVGVVPPYALGMGRR